MNWIIWFLTLISLSVLVGILMADRILAWKARTFLPEKVIPFVYFAQTYLEDSTTNLYDWLFP